MRPGGSGKVEATDHQSSEDLNCSLRSACGHHLCLELILGYHIYKNLKSNGEVRVKLLGT